MPHRKPRLFCNLSQGYFSREVPLQETVEHGRMLKCSSKFGRWKKDFSNIAGIKASNEMRNSTEQKNADKLEKPGEEKEKRP